MSTKIYGGLKFEPTKVYDHRRVDCLHSLIQKFRPQVQKWGIEAKATFLANVAVRKFDYSNYNGVALDFMTYVSRARLEMDERSREIKKDGYRDPAVDFEFKIFVIPHKNQLYGMLFTEQGAWRKKFMRQWWVNDFHYQNQTDRPSGISAKAWAHRSTIWGEIMDIDPRPIAHGFEYDLSPDPWSLPTIKQVIRLAPDPGARAASVARKLTNVKAKLEGKVGLQLAAYTRTQEYKDEVAAMTKPALASLRPLDGG